MPKLNEPLFKHLAASGAVTTNNKAGVLLQVIFIGKTAADKLEIKDGADVKITLITNTGLDPIIILYPENARPIFTTDIDATITKTGDAFASFVYKEVSQ